MVSSYFKSLLWPSISLLSLSLECLFSEGSARTGANIEAAFAKLTQTVIYKIDSGEIPEESLSTQKKI